MDHENSVAERPVVAMSMCGTIAGPAWHPQKPPLGGPQDRFMLEWLRSQADLLLYGAGTVRVERGPVRFIYPALRAEYESRGTWAVPPLAVITTSGVFDWSTRFWSTPTRKILIVPRGAQSHGTQSREMPASVETLPVASTTDVLDVLAVLGEHGFGRILCEGGRQLYASLWRQDAVDEIFYTLTPWSLGSDGVPMTPDLMSPQRLALVAATVVDQEVFLRYRSMSGRSWLPADTIIPIPSDEATEPQEA